jgi:SH3-like domain-containing protein
MPFTQPHSNQIQSPLHVAKTLMALALVPSLFAPFTAPAQAEAPSYNCYSSFRRVNQPGGGNLMVFDQPFRDRAGQPRTDVRLVKEIKNGSIVVENLQDRSRTFSEIITSDNKMGWVLTSTLAPIPGEVTRFNGFLEVRALANQVNLRAEPSLQARVIDKLTSGNVVRYGQQVGEWIYVTDSTGQSGYISNKFLVCTTARFNLRNGPDRN